MERFLQRAHDEQHVRVTFNDHPESQNGQHVLQQGELNYRNDNLRRLLNMGLDTWWFDRNWTVSLKSPFEGIPKESIGMYLFQDITKKVTPDERPLIIGNVDGITSGKMEYAPNLSSHRYSIQWTGDIMQTDTALKQEITAAVRSGAITGVPYVSADVGGHYGKNSPEQWTRWSQYAAFSPIFRYHSVGNDVNRAPWLYGGEAEDTAREYVQMRYRLMPVFYAAARKSYDTGLPITQRLDYNYPQYAESQDDTTYTIGDNILVAPIWEAGSREAIPAAWLSHKGEAGLKAEYYNNEKLVGDPVLTRTDSQIDFDWGNGSPDGSIQNDSFSARWTGTLTIGEDDARLAVTSDDGVRIWVDGKLEVDKWGASNNVTNMGDTIFKAGTNHDLKVEYYEGSGGAKIKVDAISISDEGDSREVFIPDGRWIDVWSGKTYEGPQTITVNHGFDTSPLFVRSGSILPLVDNVEYLGEKPWDKVTLDVYPSTRLDGTAELYEDDQSGVGYKEGEYRTTALTTSYDEASGETVVKVGKAAGSFNGSDAFDKRTWTVRVHALADWGEITGATVDGKAVAPVKIVKTSDASPFAISGGALDGDVYEITFEKALTAESEVRVKFATPTDETLPEPNDANVGFSAEERAVRSSVNLTAAGGFDWKVFGGESAGTVVGKADVEAAIGALQTNGTPVLSSAENAAFTWSDGKETAAGNVKKGVALSDGSFELDVKVGADARRVSLYLGADDATGRLEITGGATAKLIELEGTAQKRIVIDAQGADENGVLHVVYRKTGGAGTIYWNAVAVGDPDEDAKMAVARTAQVTDAADGINLSDPSVKDWVHLGLDGNTDAVNRKKGADPLLSGPTYEGSKMRVDDYPTISFSDGTPTQSATDCRNAVTAYQGSIAFSAPAGKGWQELKVYTGGYQSKNDIEITDEAGSAVTKLSYEVGDQTQRKIITIRFRSEIDSTLYFKISGTGHVFVAAYTLADVPDQDVVNAALSEAQTALAKLTVTNDTTADGILSALKKAVGNEEVELSWSEAFELTPATNQAAGSVTGKIALTYGKASAALTVDKVIAKLEGPEPILEGDVNGDGSVNITDVMEMCRMLARKTADTVYTPDELAAADMNGDNTITITDVMMLCKVLASR